MILGESKDELRWALCDDSVVVDLMRVAPRVVLDAIRVAGERPVRPYWRSSTDSHGASQWHYNHSARMPETGKVLPAGPVGGRPRRSIGLVLKSSSYTDWKALWETVRDALSVPDGCELLRIYQNVYPYGADGCAHVDSDEPDEVTACIYVHPHWHKDWGGETVVFDPNDEVRRAVLPAPGRLFAFRSMVPHAARPAARAAVPPRCVVVVKMGPWPIARRLANGARDAIARQGGHSRGAEGVDPELDWSRVEGPARVALATQWLLGTRAQHLPHGSRTLAGHLVATAGWLTAWGARTEIVLGGLAHALCGTQSCHARCFDPVRDRRMLETVFTGKGVALALAFASCDREALAEALRSAENGETPLELARDPAGPEGAAALGPIPVDAEMLEGLHLIDAASRLSQSSIDAHTTIETAPRPSRSA